MTIFGHTEPNKWRSVMQKKNLALIIIIMLAGMVSIMGCDDLYGKIKINPDINKLYKDRSGLPDYNYFYTGRPNLPDAVIGIDKKYQFNTRLWGKIESQKEVYKKIRNLNSTPYGNSDLIGGDIFDKNDIKIGIWFSYYNHAVVKKTPEGTIEVYTPYNPNHDRPYSFINDRTVNDISFMRS